MMNMCSDNRYQIALSFWSASFQYLMLVENTAEMIEVHNNPWVMVEDFNDKMITEEEYFEFSKWSDHTLIIPLLFNLLHGIELLIKGFLIIKPEEDIKKEHDIIHLCHLFFNIFPHEKCLSTFFNKYTDQKLLPDILKKFLKDNRIEVKDLYQAFRYPSPDFKFLRNYSTLKYNGSAGKQFFSELKEDIKNVRVNAVRLGRSLK